MKFFEMIRKFLKKPAVEEAENGGSNDENTPPADGVADSNETAEKPIYLLDTQGNPNCYTFANMQASLEEAVGSDAKVMAMVKPARVHLFGELSREGDLAQLAVLRDDVQFCNVQFHDLGNFLGALDHAGIQLEEFFAVLSPCVCLQLNGKSALAKEFFYSQYVLQTPRMIITNLVAVETNFEEFDPEWVVDWLLFRINKGDGNALETMTKRMEINGGKMEIVQNLVEMLIGQHDRGELDGTHFVLTLKGFALEMNGFGEEEGKAFSLTQIADSVWELQCGKGVNEKEEDGENGQKVQAIFEIDKFDY